ncbi:hypothetical protein [Nitriliruptor alkaliphilus]|uniref:hypothetical protein n=1 Tax=Nitriliruptor alkaliphilus TaxID=427918 RepID=UPI000697164A|nr:hypothetical protein [Nitriliruptor alkaliphilus]
MPAHTSAAIRLSSSRVEFSVPSDDGRVVDVGFDISGTTAHALRHLLAAQLDPATGRPLCGRSRTLLERVLQAAGAVVERIEVLPGDPARLALAMITPDGVVRRIDLDLLDAAELLASHRVVAVALGWPDRDWDGGLRELSR